MKYEQSSGGVQGRSYSYTQYRYGFNNQAQDGELGEYYAFEYRIHYARLGRILSVDPLAPIYSHYTPYQFASCSPLIAYEHEGLESSSDVNPTTQKTTYDVKPRDCPEKIANLFNLSVWQLAALNQEQQFANGSFFSEIRASDCKTYFSYGDYWVKGQGTMWNLKAGDKLTVWTDGGINTAKQSSIKNVDISINYTTTISIYDPNGSIGLIKHQIMSDIQTEGNRLFSISGSTQFNSAFDLAKLNGGSVEPTTWNVTYQIATNINVVYATNLSEIRPNSYVAVLKPSTSLACRSSSDKRGCAIGGGISINAVSGLDWYLVASLILHEFGHDLGLDDFYTTYSSGQVNDCKAGNLMGCLNNRPKSLLLLPSQTQTLANGIIISYLSEKRYGGYDKSVGSTPQERIKKY